MPNETTKEAYRKLANNFYLNRVTGAPTRNKIKDSLKLAAADYRPGYWRRLRNAICLDQRENAHIETANHIASIKNPLTTSNILADKERIPAKKKRVKKVSRIELAKIAEQFAKKRDPLLESALILIAILGCRPAEIGQITILDNGLVKIIGVKKRESDDRGLDRLVRLPQEQLEKVKYATHLFQKEKNKLIELNTKSTIAHLLERRLSTLTKQIWPRKKNRPTLYSLRHQFAADLKKSGTGREEIAYLMGHRATKSADVYGNGKSGGSRSVEVGVSKDELKILVTTNHQTHPRLAPRKTNQVQPSNYSAHLPHHP